MRKLHYSQILGISLVVIKLSTGCTMSRPSPVGVVPEETKPTDSNGVLVASTTQLVYKQKSKGLENQETISFNNLSTPSSLPKMGVTVAQATQTEILQSELDQARKELDAARSEAAQLNLKLKSLEQQKVQCDQRVENCEDERYVAIAGPQDTDPGTCYAQLLFPTVYTTRETEVGEEPFKEIAVTQPVYKTVMQRVLVAPEQERLKVIPAKYEMQEESFVIRPAHRVWKRLTSDIYGLAIRDTSGDIIRRIDPPTGEVLCLVEEPPVTQTVKRRVMVSPPRVERTIIPAKYRMVAVQELVSPGEERIVSEGATPVKVLETVIEKPGGIDWGEVICDVNFSPQNVMELQRALVPRYTGRIDGIYGPLTRAAVNAYQAAQGLAQGWLTKDTLKELGIVWPGR